MFSIVQIENNFTSINKMDIVSRLFGILAEFCLIALKFFKIVICSLTLTWHLRYAMIDDIKNIPHGVISQSEL